MREAFTDSGTMTWFVVLETLHALASCSQNFCAAASATLNRTGTLTKKLGNNKAQSPNVDDSDAFREQTSAHKYAVYPVS